MEELKMEKRKIQVLIIGGGPGGYVAAIKAAQLGLKVLLVEKEKLGGICLNVGCIPSKALITISRDYERIKTLEAVGIKATIESFNWQSIQRWKNSIINRLVAGVSQLCKANGAEIIFGEAEIVSDKEIRIKRGGEAEIIEYENLIIATGSKPVHLKEIPIDHKQVLDSSDVLNIEEIPKNLLIIGGGYIGIELGSVLARFGSRIIVVEMMPQILPGVDNDLVRGLERKLKKLNFEIKVNSIVSAIEKKEDHLIAIIKSNGKEEKVETEKILVAVGRKPMTDGLGLESLGIDLDSRGFIKVNERLRTNLKNIYGIGDVIGGAMLAHKAFKEGEISAEVIAGKSSIIDYKCVPAVIYTEPEIALVGMSEQEAKEAKRDIIIGKFPFAANGRALALMENDGFVKIIADKETHEILGVNIIGPNASDLISEAALAIEMGAVIEDIALTIHPHPTLSEAIMEACKDAMGEPLHIYHQKP